MTCRLITVWLFLLIVGCAAPQSSAPPTNPGQRGGVELRPDVLVYGSTPGGFCAAIAAAREGASVVLLEPTDHIGGLSTGGLSHCDSNQMVRSTVMGLFDEWHQRIVKDYTDRGLPKPYDPTKKDTARWTFEPHVAMRVTMQMLEEAGVKVLTGRYLQSVEKDGATITRLITKNGAFSAKVYIDGTYEGDLMAAAGADWTIGREGRAAFGESLAGKQYPKKKMDIDGFDRDGKPMPLITQVGLGDEAAGDDLIMTYSFRLCLTAEASNKVPIPEPDAYDPARFELVRRYLRSGGNPNMVRFDRYPLPGKKLDGNNSIGGMFSIGLIGGPNQWHAADEAGRRAIWEAHKQYTLEFIHFLRNDPAVPEGIKRQYAELGLAKDEFERYGHWPPALYVRESRRMKGMYVLSQKDILEEPTKDDPIAISSFPIDSHDVRRVAIPGGGVINEGTIFPVRTKGKRTGPAYHVPYRSVLPRPEHCDNLLVPVALSCTHVAISSLRIEGAWMNIGQGAGVAAALAAQRGGMVHDVDYPELRTRLLAQGQVLELPDTNAPADTATGGRIDPASLPGIVLDDRDAELAGRWARSTNFKPYVGTGYVHDERQGDGRSTATFRFKATKSGRYALLMAYSPHPTRATNVPVSIRSGNRQSLLNVDQRAALPEGKAFRKVGVVPLEAGVESVLTIGNGDADGFVILDALQLVPIDE